MKIALDAFGGDNAPQAVLKGAIRARGELGVTIVLVGNESRISEAATAAGIDLTGIEILSAAREFTMEFDPGLMANKEYRDTSMAVGLQAVKDKTLDAFVSAGSTGALVVGATLITGRIKGVRRAAIGAVMPTPKRPFLLLDSGATADCSPEMLENFAVLGSVYMEKALGVANPEVALVNIGAEEHKGDNLRKDTYQLLKANAKINFIGNIEPRDIPAGNADVVVADGFTGNVVLKLFEGVASTLMGMIKGVFKKNPLTMLSALLVAGGLKGIKAQMDYSEYGGAPLLGINGVVIKAHGSSDAKAFYNACRQAKKCVETGMVETLTQAGFRRAGKAESTVN
ncbi:MAG: phosphate acyltransferase PlsX [Oscillospiraceae bacterium]|nr:phosphate acyltransferase PlsX [Oscillospiraceae bacterium]